MANSTALDPVFEAAGQEWNVDPNLLRAVAGQESGGTGNPDKAVSPKGALGRMQIMPQTAQDLGIPDPTDPVQSIYGGAKYLSQQLDKYGSPELALAAYNAGPGRVDDYQSGKSALPAETVAYVPSVAQRYQALTAKPVATSDASSTAPSPSGLDQAIAKLRQGNAAAQPASQPSTRAASDPFSEALSASGPVSSTPPTAAPAANADPFSQALAASDAPTPPPAMTGGVAHNIGAGLTDAAATVGNVVSDPIGNLIGKPAATAAVFAHDVLAPVFGYSRYTDQQRNDILSDTVPQPGTAAIEGIGKAIGADPATVPANNLLEKYARAVTGGAATMAMMGPGGLKNLPINALAGASGTVAGDAAAGAVPSYAAPIASLAANALAGGATEGAGAGITRLSSALDASSAPRAAGGLAAGAPAAADSAATPANALASSAISPGPQSAGAAASRDMSPPSVVDLSPAQMVANRTRAETDKLLEPQPQGKDNNAYVPGVTPTTADIEQSVNTSRELKALGQSSPEVSEEAKSLAADNNISRQNFYRDLSGSPVLQQNLIEQRSAQANQDIEASLGASGPPVDSSELAQTVQGILDTPRNRQNDKLQSTIGPLVDRLVNADGTPAITDPMELYGFREQVNRMLSKASQAADPTLAHISGQLGEIIKATDGQIEAARPGYRTYMNNYANASRPIDTMEALQGLEPSLYDTQGNMQLSRVQNAMKSIVQARATPGNNIYKSIPDDTMANLWNLRDDLRRSATADQLARTKGSDTSQNQNDALRYAGNLAGNALMHGAANYIAPGVGSIGLSMAKNALASSKAKRASQAATARGLSMLRTDPSTLNSNDLNP